MNKIPCNYIANITFQKLSYRPFVFFSCYGLGSQGH